MWWQGSFHDAPSHWLRSEEHWHTSVSLDGTEQALDLKVFRWACTFKLKHVVPVFTFLSQTILRILGTLALRSSLIILCPSFEWQETVESTTALGCLFPVPLSLFWVPHPSTLYYHHVLLALDSSLINPCSHTRIISQLFKNEAEIKQDWGQVNFWRNFTINPFSYEVLWRNFITYYVLQAFMNPFNGAGTASVEN